MNIQDDSSNEPLGPPAPRDPIADCLHREAMAERQPVSPALHGRILEHVYGDLVAVKPRWERQFSRRLPKVAAAIVLAAGASTAWWAMRSYRATTPVVPPSVVRSVLSPPTTGREPLALPEQAPGALSINVAGILFASASPPRIGISLPFADVSPAPQQPESQPASSASSPGSPEWLLAGIQGPARSAQGAIADLVPPDVRALAAIVGLDR